ncbi:MAG: hypothetical protein WAU39_20530 [Polyangiales bacterium]
MNKAFLSLVLILAAAAWGCDSTSGTGGAGGEGGAGGAGGNGVTTTWTTPGLTIVGDECDFFVDEALAFDITIDGSMVVMQDADPQSSLEASTDSYSPQQDEVLLNGLATNDNFPPCVVQLDDAFQLLLDDPNVSLDQNDTVQVTWDHVETDVSDVPGDCAGEWFVDLPCSGEATFTLTQQVQ